MELHERLEQIFQDVFNNDEMVLTNETTAADVSGWDSIAHINLMFSIEDVFGVQFVGNQLAEFKNIGDLKKFLAANGKSWTVV